MIFKAEVVCLSMVSQITSVVAKTAIAINYLWQHLLCYKLSG